MIDHDQSTLVRIDFGPIQQPLRDLSETVAQKVYREAPQMLSAPPYVTPNLFVMIRHAMYTCDFLFYVHADETREKDCNWNPAYTFVSAPLIRSLIDSLYNVTRILQNPYENGTAFCKSGFKQELKNLREVENRYRGQPEWALYIQEKRQKINLALRQYGFTIAEIDAQTSWETMGKYLNNKRGGQLSPHQLFLKNFTYGNWREYSAMSHGGFEGLLNSISVYTRDAVPHEDRAKMDEIYPRVMSMHMGRAALLMLCIVTEVQAYFRFPSANISSRVRQVWNALMQVYEAKELYERHYADLMNSRGIRA